MSTTRIYNPLGRTAAPPPATARAALGDLNGRSIAILENTKPNALALMRHVAGHLQSRFDAVTVNEHRKESAAQAAEEAIVERIKAESTLVLVGSGD